MGKRLTRAEQNAETRRKLLVAARRLFLRKGFHDTSLAEVAASAGYTKGAVFSQFDSKDDLFLALLEERNAERIARIDRIRFEHGDADAVAAAVAEDWREQESKSSWSLLVLEFRLHAARDRAVARRYAAIHARLRRAMAAQYERHLVDAGLVATVDSDSAARAMLAIGHGVLLEQLAEPDFDAPGLVQALARGLIDDDERRG